MKIEPTSAWIWYSQDGDVIFDERKVGKWLCYPGETDLEIVINLCKKAIENNIVKRCKHRPHKNGVICFYLHDDDMEGHKRVIKFLLENNAIPKHGDKYENIAFKYDFQTHDNEYGDDFSAHIKLSELINLKTGRFKGNIVCSNNGQYNLNKEFKTVSYIGKKFAVIDTETNFSDVVMSIGIVIVDSDTLQICFKEYYIITPEYKEGGMYYYYLGLQPYKKVTREEAVFEINSMLSQNGATSIFAYNACFDYNHLPELSGYYWHDIMKIAAYKQFNPFIPDNVPLCGTGRMKTGYGVEDMLRLLSKDYNYHEKHNAICDAEDELKIIELLKIDLEKYPYINKN